VRFSGRSITSTLTKGYVVFTGKRFIAALGGSVLGLAAAVFIGGARQLLTPI
jgi:hypothetical protein